MKNIKVIFIDIDDTLLDFDVCANWAIQKAREELNVPLPENCFPIFWKINDGLWKDLEKGRITLSQLNTRRWEILFENYQIDYDSSVFDTFYCKYLSLSGMHVKHAEEVLQYLSTKYEIYTASNGPFVQQTTRMKVSGLSKYVKGYFISEEIGYSKPTKEFFDSCFKRLPSIKKEECVMIGDSLSADMKGAHEYGMQCIWFNRVHVPYENVIADFVVEELEEIKNIL